MSLIALGPGGDGTPLFLLHGMAGTVLCYRALAVRLGAGPCFGIEARGIDEREPPLDCVEAMAAAYIDEIRAHGAPPLWRVAGWSFGGLLAFEMSIQLSRAGLPVRAAMLDCRGLAERTARARPAPEVSDAGFAAHLAASDPCLRATYAAHLTALRRYRPGPTQAPLLVVRAAQAAGVVDDSLGFAPLAHGPLETIAVPASHDGMLVPPHVVAVAQALAGFLSRGDGG